MLGDTEGIDIIDKAASHLRMIDNERRTYRRFITWVGDLARLDEYPSDISVENRRAAMADVLNHLIAEARKLAKE